jgi:hypothetical protein
MDELDDLKDYEGLYKINKKGEVWSCFLKKFLSLCINQDGYYKYTLCNENGKKYVVAHRLVAKQFIPNPNNLPLIDHIDRNRLNNNVDNLRWVNYRQNQLNRCDTKHPYIYYREAESKYKVEIAIKKKIVYTSKHKDLDQAILVRDAAMILLDFPNDCYSMTT